MTEIGRVFLVGAQQVIDAAKQAVTLAQQAAKGERGRLMIGCIGPLVSSFLPGALVRFREQRPLVEVTVSHMNSRAQIKALLDGSIMLGIGYFGSATAKDVRDQLCSHLLVRSPFGIECSKARRFSKRAAPKLRDFHDDQFLCFDSENGHDYEDFLRELCQRVGGFEPRIGPRVNSPESLVSMIAAGRGVFLGVQIGVRGGAAATDFYPLNERDTQFELSAIWRKQSRAAENISTFIGVIEESINARPD